MDKFWSVAAMPLGVFFCFSPVIIAWIMQSLRNHPEQSGMEQKERK